MKDFPAVKESPCSWYVGAGGRKGEASTVQHGTSTVRKNRCSVRDILGNVSTGGIRGGTDRYVAERFKWQGEVGWVDLSM